MIKKNSTKNICIEFKMIKEITLAIVVLKKKTRKPFNINFISRES